MDQKKILANYRIYIQYKQRIYIGQRIYIQKPYQDIVQINKKRQASQQKKKVQKTERGSLQERKLNGQRT